MEKLSSKYARNNFAEVINKVAYGSEPIAIERRGKELAYLISAKDFKLFQQLIEQAEEAEDIKAIEEWEANPNKETIPADQFWSELYAELEAECIK